LLQGAEIAPDALGELQGIVDAVIWAVAKEALQGNPASVLTEEHVEEAVRRLLPELAPFLLHNVLMHRHRG
jgi:hypothetical protein